MLEQTRPARSIDPFANFVNDITTVVNRYKGDKWVDPQTAPGAIVVDSATSYSEMVFDYVLVKRGKELGGSREQGADTDPTAPKKLRRARRLGESTRESPRHGQNPQSHAMS